MVHSATGRGQRACAAAAQGRSDSAATHSEPKTGGAELFFAVSTATPAIRHAKVIKPIRYHVMAAPPVMHRKGHAGSGDQQRHQDDHGFGRCRFTCAPSASRDRADERAGDPLHRGRIDGKASGDLANAIAGILAGFQSRTDALLDVGCYARPAKRFAFADSPAKPSADTFCDHRALKLAEYAEHLKHGLVARRRGVQSLLVQKQVDAKRVQLGQEAHEVLQAAAEPIHRPRHHHVEPALGGIAQQPVKLGPPVPAFSATDAVVFVDADDLAAHAACDFPQLPLLISRGLVSGRNPQIENGAFHLNPVIDAPLP